MPTFFFRSILFPLMAAAILLALPATQAHAGACPPGTYGPLCLDCPGGSANPCSGQGTCDDGNAGSGDCSCNVGIIGTACDQCPADIYNYPSCNVSCTAGTTCSGAGTCNAAGGCDCDLNIVGASCDQCSANLYSYPACDVFCDAATTCSNFGTCNAAGTCDCSPGHGGASCNQVIIGCGSEPAGGCAGIPDGKSVFKIKYDPDNDAKDQLSWLWAKGDAVAQDDTNNPMNNATYSLCVYDSPAGVDSLAIEITVGPGASWADADPKGWKYKDKNGLAHGVRSIQVKTGTAGKASAKLKGKGSALPLPVPASVTEYLAMDAGVTVQMLNSDTNFCWSATYATASKNTATSFQATIP